MCSDINLSLARMVSSAADNDQRSEYYIQRRILNLLFLFEKLWKIMQKLYSSSKETIKFKIHL